MNTVLDQKIPVLGHGYVMLLETLGSDHTIAAAARVSRAGEGTSPDIEADRALLANMMQRGHLSPFEQAALRVEVRAPIFVARQWMRHRTFSFVERSRRFSTEPPDFYCPTVWRGAAGKNGALTARYKDFLTQSAELYDALIADSVAPELARLALPVSLYTTFVVRMDVRNLMHFLDLRTGPAAQEEILAYAMILWDILAVEFPLTAQAYLSGGRHE